MSIVWYPLEFSRLHNLHPWYSNPYMVSSPLGRIHHVSVANAIHNSPFIFVPPGTHHCWVDRGGMIWEAFPTPLHMAGSVTQAPVTHPSTNRARCCLTSVIWRELVTTWPCANTCMTQKNAHLNLYIKWTGNITIFYHANAFYAICAYIQIQVHARFHLFSQNVLFFLILFYLFIYLNFFWGGVYRSMHQKHIYMVWTA